MSGGRSSRVPGDDSTELRSSRRWCASQGCRKGGWVAPRDRDAEGTLGERRAMSEAGTDAARRAVRKVIRDARGQEQVAQDLISGSASGCPVALQIVLVAALLGYTNSRFPGFINATNISQILILALPLIVAAMAQNHALLVGYLDLSVGGHDRAWGWSSPPS